MYGKSLQIDKKLYIYMYYSWKWSILDIWTYKCYHRVNKKKRKRSIILKKNITIKSKLLKDETKKL